jgi:hypothetical protein
MPQLAMSGSTRDVTENVLAWLHGPDAHEVGSQVAAWGPAQWLAARRTLDVHGVAPGVFVALERSGALMALPPELARQVRARHALNVRQLAAVRREAKRLFALGQERGIALVPLRDTALAFHYHDQPELRSTPGVDFLVRPHEEARLVGALARAGWREIVRAVGPPVVVQAERPPGPTRAGGQPLRSCTLKVLTGIDASSAGIRFDLTFAYWVEARPGRHDGTPGLLPSPLRLMQHLLIQASQSLMALRLRLVDLGDVAAVGRRLGAPDWEVLVDEARHRDEERLFWAPLRLAERYFGASAPMPVMADLRRRVPAALRDWVEAAGGDDFADTSVRAAIPKERARWCRSSWDKLVLMQQLLRSLPSKNPVVSFARTHLDQLRGLARRGWAARLARRAHGEGEPRGR